MPKRFTKRIGIINAYYLLGTVDFVYIIFSLKHAVRFWHEVVLVYLVDELD